MRDHLTAPRFYLFSSKTFISKIVVSVQYRNYSYLPCVNNGNETTIQNNARAYAYFALCTRSKGIVELLCLSIHVFYFSENVTGCSRVNSVGMATDYGLDGRGLIPGRGKRFFSSPQCPGSYPIGTGASFPKGKAVGA
jgi:hypothetical protein